MITSMYDVRDENGKIMSYKVDTIQFGTILREKDGKFIVDGELTEKSLEKIEELEKEKT